MTYNVFFLVSMIADSLCLCLFLKSKSLDLRDAFDEVPFCRVAYASEIRVQCFTPSTSCLLVNFVRGNVETVAVVAMPAGRTQ